MSNQTEGLEPHEMPIDEERPEEDNPEADSAGVPDDGLEN